MWKSNKNRKPIQKGHQSVDGQRAHKMVLSGSQGIPITRQKKQKNISGFFPQNNKWDFSLCPSLTPIISDKYTSYGEMSKLKTTWFESRRGRTEKGEKMNRQYGTKISLKTHIGVKLNHLNKLNLKKSQGGFLPHKIFEKKTDGNQLKQNEKEWWRFLRQ